MKRTWAALALAGVLWAGAAAQADDWANWLGPNRDGTSNEKGLLREWPAGGPAVLWRAPIEQGWSCPSVSGGEIFLTSAKAKSWYKDVEEVVQCLDAKDGREKWRYAYKVASYNTGWSNGGPRSTPAVTDKFVYTIGLMGNIHCLDRKTGAVVWQLPVLEQIYPDALADGEKGFNQSPVIVDGVIGLFVNQWDSRDLKEGEKRDTIIVGIDAASGKVKWTFREPLREKTLGCDCSSAAVAEFGGEKCFVWVANRLMRALRASDGKELWRFDDGGPGYRGTGVATLLVRGNCILDAMTDYGKPTLVEVNRDHAPFNAKVLWVMKDILHSCRYDNFVPWGDGLYGFDGKYGSNALDAADMRLICVDSKTGKTLWAQGGFKFGFSLIAADGLLFVRSYQTLRLVEAAGDGYHEKGKIGNLHALPNKAHTQGLGDWVLPVLSNGKLYLRMPTELICYKVSK